MKLRKLLAFLFMGAVLAGGICSCGDDDDDLTTNNTQGNQQQGNNQQGNQQQGNQQDSQSSTGLASLLKNTKWMGIVDRMETVVIYNLISPKNNDTIQIDAHDTIWVNFGVGVEYPTYTIRVYERKTNKQYRDLSMWFDSSVKDNALRISFRSFNIGDPGYRDIFTSGGKYFIHDADDDIELKQVK